MTARSGKGRELPPPLELECLKALWVIGEGNVRAVRAVMLRDRSLAYTTVMTVLDRLARRGGVARRKVGRSFIYSPVLSRESLRKVAIRELVECYFDGSEEQLREYLQPERAAAAHVGDSAEPRLDASLL